MARIRRPTCGSSISIIIHGKSRFSVVFRGRDAQAEHTISDLTLPMPGRHNALNATAAIAVAHNLLVPDAAIRKALASFRWCETAFHPNRRLEWRRHHR